MINLHTKYEGKIQSMCVGGSLLAGRLSNEYQFTGGKTVKMTIPQTVPMCDYTRTGTSRYGDPQEMQDIVQEMTITQDKSFSMTIDKGNNLEQSGVKSAGRMLGLQLKERAIPLADTYGFARLAKLAGSVVGNTTALTKENICERISQGTLALDNAEISQEDRTLFIPADKYLLLKHSTEFLGNEKLGERALAKGQVGEYDDMAVVKVPNSRWPANVNFIIAQKSCASFPMTLNETKLHEDPPGISGNLLEGRQIYDLFVFAARCKGVYAEINTASGAGVICAEPVIASTGAITTTTAGASITYTTDGSDPRYSDSAVTGSAVTPAKGMVIRAYAWKEGAFPSSVAEYTAE